MTGLHQSNTCQAKTNELVERLAEREARDRNYFGRLRHQREKKLRDPQDVSIEADRLRQQLKKRPAQRRANSGTIARRRGAPVDLTSQAISVEKNLSVVSPHRTISQIPFIARSIRRVS
jgi:hypothetical protein